MKVISKSTKKQCILISLLLACVLCIVGFFGIFSGKDERISASATTTTDESKLYWEAGAGIFTGDLASKRIRFILHVHKDALNKGELVITLNDGGNEDCFFDVYGFTGNVRNTANNILGVNNEYTTSITEKELRFNTDKLQSAFSGSDWVIIWAVAQSDLYTNISMTAKNLGYSAESDERSWLYVYNAWSNATGNVGTTWERGVASFSNANNNTTAFVMYDDFGMDSVYGLQFLVNVPRLYSDKIAQGEQLVDIEYGEIRGQKYTKYARYEQYFLSFNLVCGNTAPNANSTVWDSGTVLQTWTTLPTVLQNGTVLQLNAGVRGDYLNGGRWYYVSLVKKVTEQKRGGLYGLEMLEPTISYQVESNTNSINANVRAKATEILYNDDIDLTESERTWLLDIEGSVPQTEELEVSVIYRKLSDITNPSSITYVSTPFFVKRVDIYSKRLVTQAMYNLVEGKSTLSDFNVCYKGQFWQNGNVYNTGERIILQATGYEYRYNEITQKGELTILYNEFQYKELALKVVNNDLESNLEMLCYTTDARIDSTTNNVVMRWDFAMIEETLLNSCKWHFTLSEGDFKINRLPSNAVCSFEKVNDIPTALILSFPQSAESQLISTDIVVSAYIEPIVDCNVNYQYVKLSVNDSGEIVEETVTSDTFIMDSMTVKQLNLTNFLNEFGEIVNGALYLDEVEGDYFKVKAIQRHQNNPSSDGTPSYTFVVQYEYNALFKITNNFSSDVRYVELNDMSARYYGTDFVRSNDIPVGYRVASLTTTTNDLKITLNAERPDDYKKTQIDVKIDVNQKKILPIHIVYTDKWHLTFDYFETYKDTPFAIKKTYNGDISVKDYPNIRAMTATDICNATGIPAVVVKIIKVDEKVDITFDGVATYTAVLDYSHASMATRDYDGGNLQEIQVPLSKYEDWVTGLGNPNWSIMMLNTEKNKYFQFSNDVERDKLYGLFSTAVFEEEVSDLNFYFRNQTGDGYMTIFEHTEATGSRVYKFFYKMTDKEITFIPGRVGMFFCEVLNDDNKMLHSYAFYLDGSTNEPFMSNGGADDKYDDDTALENKGEDFWDNVKSNVGNGWNKFKNSKWYTVAKVLLWVAGGCLVAGVAWKYGRRFFVWVTSDKQSVKRSDWTPTYAQKSKRKSKSKSKSKRKSRRK